MVSFKFAPRRDEASIATYRGWFAAVCLVVLTMAAFLQYQDEQTALLLETYLLEEDSSATASVRRTSSNRIGGHSFQRLEEKKWKLSTKDTMANEKEQEDAKHTTTYNNSSSNNNTDDINAVYFLNSTQLNLEDGFSASWLQTRADFMSMPFEKVDLCESAAFRAYDNDRKHKMRMTLDWMDMSVEHMSKWWKILQWEGHDPIPYTKMTSQFKKYVQGAQQYPAEASHAWRETVAVVAFQAYTNKMYPERAHGLTYLSLAATLESLRRAGFGRVTVGVMVDSEIDCIRDAFKVLLDVLEPGNTHDSKNNITQIGHMEVGYARVSQEDAKTKILEKNMPLAVLLGLKDAFTMSELPESERTPEMTQNMTTWLGNKQEPSYWKYVYLTEPDTILQTRPSTLAALKTEVDKGSVLLPHRLQPIPHESDVMGMSKEKNSFLFEEEFPEILTLDPINSHDVCCDENAGQHFKPGRPPNYDTCGIRFWYTCGFAAKLKGIKNRHERLLPYKLFRMTGGTGIVSLAATEHGRRCIPKKNGICRPSY